MGSTLEGGKKKMGSAFEGGKRIVQEKIRERREGSEGGSPRHLGGG